jgi:hypothetical protein
MLYVGNTPGTMSVGHYPENLAVDLSYGRVRAPLTSLRVRRDGPWEPIEEVPTEVCYNCGHHYRTPDEHTVGDDDLIRAYTLQGRYSDTWICESCSSNIYTCDDCGEPMLADDSHTTPNGDTLCEDCFDREWTNCCGCGEPTRNGDIRRDEDGDAMCPSCYRQASVICSYHSSGAKNASKFGESPEAGKAWYGMGIELEMSHKDCADEDDLEEIAKSVGGMLPDGLVFFERDGSVDYGFEMITAPMTFGYFRDNLSMFSDVLRYCSSEGMVSHNSDSSCGIHIHLSKTAFGEFESEQEYTTTKMVLLYERFYNDLKTLSRRNSHQLNSYAERYGTENLGSIDSNVKSKGGSRFRAVNLRNDNTIEVRMWRGTLNPKTFAATVELTIALLETAKRKNVRTIQKARSLRSCIGKQYLAAHPVLDEYMASKGL